MLKTKKRNNFNVHVKVKKIKKSARFEEMNHNVTFKI